MRHEGMKLLTYSKFVVTGIVSVFLLANCTTYYDAQGNPVQAVDPAAATVGAVAVGAAAYAVANNNNHHRRGYWHRGRWHRY